MVNRKLPFRISFVEFSSACLASPVTGVAPLGAMLPETVGDAEAPASPVPVLLQAARPGVSSAAAKAAALKRRIIT